MHEECSAKLKNGKEIVDKIRMIGFSIQYMTLHLIIEYDGDI
jgi:hypothetical protein